MRKPKKPPRVGGEQTDPDQPPGGNPAPDVGPPGDPTSFAAVHASLWKALIAEGEE